MNELILNTVSGGCIYGLLQLPVGLDLKVLVPRDSYLSEELEVNMKHYSAYGGYCFCVTKGGGEH